MRSSEPERHVLPLPNQRGIAGREARHLHYLRDGEIRKQRDNISSEPLFQFLAVAVSRLPLRPGGGDSRSTQSHPQELFFAR